MSRIYKISDVLKTNCERKSYKIIEENDVRIGNSFLNNFFLKKAKIVRETVDIIRLHQN